MEAIRHIGGYCERWKWVEDFDLYLRLLVFGKLSNVSEILLKYRQYFDSTNFTHGAAQRKLVLERVNIERAKRSLNLLDQLPDSAHDLAPEYLHLKWAEWALGDRRLKASAKHALKSLLKNVYTCPKVSVILSRVAWGYITKKPYIK